MAHNFLEQLVAEWYEYQGYYVRRNVNVGKRPNGGYECELDVVAFHPETKHLIHVEPSMDSSSWKQREQKYTKKFEAGKKYIPKLFKGMNLSEEIDQVALLVFASNKNIKSLGGGRILLINELITNIFNKLKETSIYTNAISEQFTILRSFQFVVEYKTEIIEILRQNA